MNSVCHRHPLPIMACERNNVIRWLKGINFDKTETSAFSLGDRFMDACFHFEELHGQRAANDYRNGMNLTLPPYQP